MTAPLVGIVGHGYVVPRGPVQLAVTGTPRHYADRVAAAGGRPVVLPAGHALDLLDAVSALVLTGGGDLDPATYGGDPAAALGVDAERDADELALVREAARRRIPVLGVCRGLQVLVVAFGATLVADLGTTHRCPELGHGVECASGSLVGSLLGGRARVTSLHHQSVAEPGPSWRVTALADDGVVEAAEWAERAEQADQADQAGEGEWAALGVQWHPELPEDPTGPAVFGWLVAAARECPQLVPGAGRSLAAPRR